MMQAGVYVNVLRGMVTNGLVFLLAILTVGAAVATFSPTAGAQSQTALFSPETKRVGRVVEVAPAAYGTPLRQQRHILGVDEPVFGEEIIETSDDGGISIELLDGSELYIGEGSRLALQRFVYDAASQQVQQVLRFVTGSFRVVSGRFAKETYRFETPVATIGIRGTDFEVVVDRFGRTTVAVHEGSVVVSPLSGESVVVEPDAQATIPASGSGVRTARARFSRDPMLLLDTPPSRERATRRSVLPVPSNDDIRPVPPSTQPRTTNPDDRQKAPTDATEAFLSEERERLDREVDRARETVATEAERSKPVLNRATRRLEQMRENTSR